MGKIHVIGIGLDGEAGLSKATRLLIEQAALIVGSERHLAYFPDFAAQQLPLGELSLAINQLQVFCQSDCCEAAVVLTSGDPLFFGLGRLLLEQLPAELITFHPHLSSIQLAFSRLKLPWQDAALLSIHGRDMDELGKLLQRCHPKIAVLTDPVQSPAAIAELILSLKLPIHYRCAVCENLGGQKERVIADLTPEALQEMTFDSLSIVVLTQNNEEKALETLPLLGIADRHFVTFPDRPGLMTKREIRSLILAELALQPSQVVWDIGAGTGSVSVEIARLCPQSQLYAIERTAVGIGLIQKNLERFDISNVHPIAGTVPEALQDLPAPDRIFIGGSGGQLAETLEVCAERLQVGGLVLLAIATLETLAQAQQWFAAQHWHVNLMQVQLSKGAAIAQLTRWAAMNPVTLLTARPPSQA